MYASCSNLFTEWKSKHRLSISLLRTTDQLEHLFSNAVALQHIRLIIMSVRSVSNGRPTSPCSPAGVKFSLMRNCVQILSMYRTTKRIPAVFPSHEQSPLTSFLPLTVQLPSGQAAAVERSVLYTLASRDQRTLRGQTCFGDLYMTGAAIHSSV